MSCSRLLRLATCCSLVGLLLSASACSLDAEVVSLASTFLPQIVRYKLLGTMGDPSLDAIFDSKAVLEHLELAEWLMVQGREGSDPGLMEEAIEKRPRDWRYRIEAAVLYLAQGDALSARQHLREGENAVPERHQDQAAYSLAVVDRLAPLKAQLDQERYVTIGQCQLLHDQLVHSYNWLWTLEGKSGESPQARAVAAQRLTCSEHVRD